MIAVPINSSGTNVHFDKGINVALPFNQKEFANQNALLLSLDTPVKIVKTYHKSRT